MKEDDKIAVVIPYYKLGSVINYIVIETDDSISESEYITILENRSAALDRPLSAKDIQEALSAYGCNYTVGAIDFNQNQMETFSLAAAFYGVKVLLINEGYPIEFEKPI